jgi:hypothetical protein
MVKYNTGVKICLTKRSDTVGEPRRAINFAPYTSSLNSEELGKSYAELSALSIEIGSPTVSGRFVRQLVGAYVLLHMGVVKAPVCNGHMRAGDEEVHLRSQGDRIITIFVFLSVLTPFCLSDWQNRGRVFCHC